MPKNYLVNRIVYPDGWLQKPENDKGENEIASVLWTKRFCQWYIQIKKGDLQQDVDRLIKHLTY